MECPTNKPIKPVKWVHPVTKGDIKEDVGPAPHFLSLLSKWPTAIPLNSLWTINFVTPRIKADVLTEPKEPSSQSNPTDGARGADAWMFDMQVDDIGRLAEMQDVKTIGNWFRSNMVAMGIKLMGDAIITDRVGAINSEGYLKGLVTNGRQDLGTLDVAFLETNISYVDTILRPWLLKIATDSLIAYDNPKIKLRSDIACNLYALSGPGKAPRLRKSYYFYNAFPMDVEGEDYNFTASEVRLRTTRFAFTHYAMIQGADSLSDKCGPTAGASYIKPIPSLNQFSGSLDNQIDV